jgi:hypothetical protein
LARVVSQTILSALTLLVVNHLSRSVASGYKPSRLSWLEITPDFSWD